MTRVYVIHHTFATRAAAARLADFLNAPDPSNPDAFSVTRHGGAWHVVRPWNDDADAGRERRTLTVSRIDAAPESGTVSALVTVTDGVAHCRACDSTTCEHAEPAFLSAPCPRALRSGVIFARSVCPCTECDARRGCAECVAILAARA